MLFRSARLQPSVKGVQPEGLVQRLEGLEAEGGTDLLSAAESCVSMLRNRSLVVVISDFMDDPKRVKDAVRLLGEHDLILLQVAGPGEVSPGFEGDALLRDSETGEELKMYMSDRAGRRYSRLVKRHAREVGRAARGVGGDHLAFATSRPPLAAMFDLMSRR